MPFRGRNFRGFPFDDEEGSGAWSELAARHPDIAARLRQRDPAAWARKRRSPQPAEFGDGISNFDRFPFNDIPPEFREHFPSPWNRRFGPREDGQPQEQFQHPQQPQPHPPQQPQPPRRQSTATQTEYPEQNIPHSSEAPTEQQQIPQHGLRNTVDLGQKSAADPRLVDGEDRSQRSMSAPPDSRPQPTMSAPHSQQEPAHGEQPHSQSQQKVRNIPIFVEGRDAPVINKNVDNASHFGDAKPAYTPPPPHVPPHHVPPHHVPPHHVPPHHVPLDDSYFVDDAPMYHPPRNFSQSFGTPYGNKFRPNPQPFAQQKVYPQGAAFARGASPGRAQSPKPHPNEEIKIPVQREKPAPQRPQPTPHQHPPHPQQHQPPPPPQQPQQQQPQQQPPPPQPPKQQPQPQDPITQILAIQTDVLNLMTDVEKFIGNKKDKQYLWLDEMLTRNLLKLDNIETDGKENIRNARKEAIRCIQKCIAVLEAKADGRSLNAQPQENQQPADVDMKAEGNAENGPPKSVENGEVEMKESKDQTNTVSAEQQPQADANIGAAAEQSKENPPQANDTRPGDKAPGSESKDAAENTKETEKKPKKGGKTKKRDKSKDNSTKTDGKDNKSGEKAGNVESSMQVDDNGNKEPQKMEVDGASQ